MENNLEPKALSDLIKNPSAISSIINDPAEQGMKFYQALPSKDKQYVAFAAGLGLLAYGLFLNRKSQSEAAPSTGNAQPEQNQNQPQNQSQEKDSPSAQTLPVKKNKK